MNIKKDKKIVVAQVLRTIKPQFIEGPDGRLMYAIVAGAISESVKMKGTDYPLQARRYLFGDIIHAELAGVDVEWIKSVMQKYGLIDLWVNQQEK